MLMSSMYSILVDEFRADGVSLHEAVERVDELLMPVQKARAAQNRRTFGPLLAAARAGAS